MFEEMMARFEEETVRYLYLMQILDSNGNDVFRPQNAPGVTFSGADTGDGEQPQRRRRASTSIDDMEEEFQRKKRRELDQARMAGSGDGQAVQQVVRGGEKVGRNDPCPCGSGKKYKKCCGA